MLNLIISTGAFFVAAWLANRYLDEMELPKSMARSLLVLVVALIVSWGAGEMADWTQVKMEGPHKAAQPSIDLSQLLKAVSQSRH